MLSVSNTTSIQVSLIDLEGPNKLYEKHIASELSPAVISLQFATCSIHGFEKNVLAVATKDSSVLAVEIDTGSTLSLAMVHPKKPSKALLMQVLGINIHFLDLYYTTSDLNWSYNLEWGSTFYCGSLGRTYLMY